MSIIAKTPEQTTEVFVHYFNEGDVDRLIAAYYGDGAVLAAAPGTAAGGRDLRTALQAYLDARGTMTAATRRVLVSGDTALLVIDWVIHAKQPIFGTSTDVVRRGSDGVWRCVIDNPHNVR